MGSVSGIYLPFRSLTGVCSCSGGRHGASSRRLLPGWPAAPWYLPASYRAARASSPGRYKNKRKHLCTCQVLHTVFNITFILTVISGVPPPPIIFCFTKFFTLSIYKFPQTASLKRKPCLQAAEQLCLQGTLQSFSPSHANLRALSVGERLPFGKPFCRVQSTSGLNTQGMSSPSCRKACAQSTGAMLGRSPWQLLCLSLALCFWTGLKINFGMPVMSKPSYTPQQCPRARWCPAQTHFSRSAFSYILTATFLLWSPFPYQRERVVCADVFWDKEAAGRLHFTALLLWAQPQGRTCSSWQVSESFSQLICLSVFEVFLEGKLLRFSPDSPWAWGSDFSYQPACSAPLQGGAVFWHCCASSFPC